MFSASEESKRCLVVNTLINQMHEQKHLKNCYVKNKTEVFLIPYLALEALSSNFLVKAYLHNSFEIFWKQGKAEKKIKLNIIPKCE